MGPPPQNCWKVSLPLDFLAIPERGGGVVSGATSRTEPKVFTTKNILDKYTYLHNWNPLFISKYVHLQVYSVANVVNGSQEAS